jgi:O-antigen ligase
VSTVWSIAPDQSWIEANRIVTYLAVFAMGFALVRLAGHRWVALLGGVTIASVAISAYALAHKSFPGQFEPDEIYARLREPFGYWNAVGLMAAMGVPGCLWLGARRAGHRALNALAYPATGLLIVVILLSYSRGALLALVLGCAFWFAVVPLRLRGAAVLLCAAVGATFVIGWAFSQDALSKDNVPLALRNQAGHQLALLTIFMLVALTVVGLLLGFLTARRAPRAETRRRAGIALLVGLALVPLGVGVRLAVSDRGLFGSISHDWHQLTDPNASTPSNAPGRLTSVGSVRARYWNEALKIFRDHPWIGVGAGGYQDARLRYRNDDLSVQHAHGYVVQVLADRGILGLVLSLAALVALAFAIAQATGLRRRGPPVGTSPERVGLLTLTAVIVVFGVHSFVDWTWFVPGVAIPAVLIGGWLAGRGPQSLPPGPDQRLRTRARRGLDSQARLALALLCIALAGAAAWAAWQPQRSIDLGNEALVAAGARPQNIPKARTLAAEARRINPLSIEPLLDQAAVESMAGNAPGVFRALHKAVRLQPANPVAWTRLAYFELRVAHDPALAKKSLAAALYLDPRSYDAIQLLILANRGKAATY